MAVITISRGSASGGRLLAEGVAANLGYGIVSREDVVHEAAKFGVSEEKLQEAILKPLGILDRLKYERTRFTAFIQTVLCEYAQQDNIVYHGNAGHLLLQGVSHVFCVRLIAPPSYRIRRLMEEKKMDPDEAARHIETVDQQRRAWTLFLYGVDPLDPDLYDLVINLKRIDLECAVELVVASIKRKEFETTEESNREMANLALAARVRAALAANEETASATVEVRAKDGVVFLKGKSRSDAMVAAILDVAGKVEGVREVKRQDLDSPDLLV
jgi:cytidylate kinase